MSRKFRLQKFSLRTQPLSKKMIRFCLWGLLSCCLFSIVTADSIQAIAFSRNSTTVEIEIINDTELTQNRPVIPATMALNQIDEFPLGIYDRIDKPEHLDSIKAIGFNIVMPYTEPYAKKDYQRIKNYLDVANKKGLKIVLELFRDSIKQQDTTELTNFVRTFKNHPAVLGWYSYDEPVYNKISPEILASTYNIVKAEDPNHPVFLDFSGTRSHNLVNYRGSFDVVQVNHYPITKGGNALEDLSSFKSNLDTLEKLTLNIPYWSVVQSFEDKKKWRLPNFQEEKYLIYSSLLNGADGLFFYSYHRAPEKWRQSVLKPSVGGLKKYLPAIDLGALNIEVNSSSDDLQTALYRQPNTNQYVLIAINHSKQEVEAQIKLDSNLKIDSVQEKNSLSLDKANSSFSDSFAPLKVKVYTLVASN